MPAVILPEPPQELKHLSQLLLDRIKKKASALGCLPFSAFMEMALYEPGLGYYSAGLHKFGADGDFITAPELGSLFAAGLAVQIDEIVDRLPSGPFDILEVGAGTGQLAADLLNHLKNTPARYCILERSADLRDRQQQTLESEDQIAERNTTVEWLDRLPENPWQGIIVANELLDAMPVERFRVGRQDIEQQCLLPEGDWHFEKASDSVRHAVETIQQQLDHPLPEGYVSEINLDISSLLGGISESMTGGAALLIDYGYPRKEYYLPERRDGTLICHYRHRAHDDVMFYPGLQDMTAFVDFTAVAEAADDCDLDVSGYTSQAMFLLGCGVDQFLLDAPGPDASDLDQQLHAALAAQARHLLMPGNMGERFQVMALTRGLSADDPLCGFSHRDLTHRL